MQYEIQASLDEIFGFASDEIKFAISHLRSKYFIRFSVFHHEVISLAVRRISLKKDLLSQVFFLVEMAGVEPASENLFPKLSTSVVYLLKFPWDYAERQA